MSRSTSAKAVVPLANVFEMPLRQSSGRAAAPLIGAASGAAVSGTATVTSSLIPHRHEAAHFARVEQPHRIHLVFESQLIGIDALVAAAVLERDDMRIGDHDAAGFIARHD